MRVAGWRTISDAEGACDLAGRLISGIALHLPPKSDTNILSSVMLDRGKVGIRTLRSTGGAGCGLGVREQL